MHQCRERTRNKAEWKSWLLFSTTLIGSLGSLLFLPAEGLTQSKEDRSSTAKKPTTGVYVPEGSQTPEYLMFDRPFQQGNQCGPNSLYFLLRLLNKSVNYEEVLERLPVGEEGCSLEDIQKAAAYYGVRLAARRLTPEELYTAPKPLIIHMLSPAIGDGKKAPTGHFTVLIRTMPGDALLGIDTSNAILTTFPPQGLARSFSGYALVPDTAFTWVRSKEGIVFIAFLVGVVALNVIVFWRLSTEKKVLSREQAK